MMCNKLYLLPPNFNLVNWLKKNSMQKCSQVFVEFTNYRQKQEVRVCENYGHPPKTSLVIQVMEEK